MIKIANKLTNLLTNNNDLTSEEKKWYSYIIEKTLVKIISHSLIFLIGSMVSNPINSITFIFAISQMRKFSNGWHSKSFLVCLISSCLVSVFSLNYGILILEISIFFKYGIILFASVLIFISKDSIIERACYFKCYLMIFIVLIIVSDIIDLHILSNILSISVIFTAFTILPNIIKKETENEKSN